MTSIEDTLNVRQNGSIIYKIAIDTCLDRLASHFEPFHIEDRCVCIVTDSNVGPLYAHVFLSILEPLSSKLYTYEFKAGESNKNMDSILALYKFLISNGFGRGDLLIALGGGVTGDMTGYAAATYMRGIQFIQIPTTLLAQVDSSIGGKTGVDLDGYKNIIGAFHSPGLVFIDTKLLDTLPDDQFASGLGEIIKHGLICSSDYYKWLNSHSEDILLHDPEHLQKMIYDSCVIKANIVEGDPTEKGDRALLNFGHTLGHAIERESGFRLTHGACVALGCIAASYISAKRGYIAWDDLNSITETFKRFGLPVEVSGMSEDDILKTVENDKKKYNGTLRFILLKRIGEAFICCDVTRNEMASALRFIMVSQNLNN